MVFSDLKKKFFLMKNLDPNIPFFQELGATEMSYDFSEISIKL
jgi:hypothetical protein